MGQQWSFRNGFCVSVGFGLSGNTWYPNEDRFNILCAILSETKYSFLNRSISPYVGLKIQGDILLNNRSSDDSVSTKDEAETPGQNSLTLLPEIGIDFKRFSLYAGFGVARHSKQFVPTAGLGAVWYLKW